MTITEQQREARRWFIGSSDAAAACGVSPYTSRLELWLDKTGRRERTPMDAERGALGNLLEPVVGAFFELRHPELQAVPVTETIFDDYRAANLDFIVEPSGVPLEAKTAHGFRRPDFEDTPPMDYLVQVEHQLAVRQRGDEAWLSVLIGGTEPRDFELVSDPNVRRDMLALEADFWQHVVEDRAPEPRSASDVLLLHATDNARYIPATPELRAVHAELQAIAKHQRELRERRQKLVDQLALVLGADAGVAGDYGRPLISWRAPTAPNIDWQSVCAELYNHVARSTYDQAVRKHSAPYPRRVIPH